MTSRRENQMESHLIRVEISHFDMRVELGHVIPLVDWGAHSRFKTSVHEKLKERLKLKRLRYKTKMKNKLLLKKTLNPCRNVGQVISLVFLYKTLNHSVDPPKGEEQLHLTSHVKSLLTRFQNNEHWNKSTQKIQLNYVSLFSFNASVDFVLPRCPAWFKLR